MLRKSGSVTSILIMLVSLKRPFWDKIRANACQENTVPNRSWYTRGTPSRKIQHVSFAWEVLALRMQGIWRYSTGIKCARSFLVFSPLLPQPSLKEFVFKSQITILRSWRASFTFTRHVHLWWFSFPFLCPTQARPPVWRFKTQPAKAARFDDYISGFHGKNLHATFPFV